MKANCARCWDEGHVCEDHPEFPWEGMFGSTKGHPAHGAAGSPCPACCSPVPGDATTSAAVAFAPNWRRGEPS